MDLSTPRERAAPAGRQPWIQRLVGAPPAAAAAAWLEELHAQLPAARRCVVLLRTQQHQLQLAAVQPAGAPVQDLSRQLALAAASPAGERFQTREGGWLVTQPLAWAQEVRGLVAVELAEPEQLDAVAQCLAWGAGWLLAATSGQGSSAAQEALAESRGLLQSLAGLLGERNFDAACLSLANRLAVRWNADTVLVGWVQGLRTGVVARSNASRTEQRANITQVACAAMDEALDLRQTVQGWSGNGFASEAGTLHAHAELARAASCEAVTTALLFHEGAPVGAVMLQRATPLSAAELELLDTQCMMLAPLLVQRKEADRSLLQHAGASLRHGLRRLGDDSLLAWKLGALGLAGLVAAAALTPVPFRVTAPAVVEGEVQRAIVAPFQGFVQHAHLRAGDTVRAGDVIATLEDNDLKLEAQKWRAELDLAQRKEREAVAAGKRVEMRLAAAQGAQARAQLELAEEKLRRVQLVAPFDGVIVRGDLSQQRGSPVEQGKVLFEVAPLTAWRLILKIDERDIGRVDVRNPGELALAGFSGVRHPFTVKRITSIATADNGVNHFRAEADLAGTGLKLRPGMEGVAKIEAGTESALWVATRRLVGWLRLTAWEWAP